MKPEILELKIHNGVFKRVDGELEKRCSTCREYFPLTTEFFHRNRYEPDGFNRQCKADYIGYLRKHALKKQITRKPKHF